MSVGTPAAGIACFVSFLLFTPMPAQNLADADALEPAEDQVPAQRPEDSRDRTSGPETLQPGSQSTAVPSAPQPRSSRPPETRDVSENPIKFARNFFSDQKRIYYSFPVQLAQGKHWKPTLAVAGATAGLVAIDPWQARTVRRNSESLEGFNNFFSENTTTRGVLLAPAVFYAAGLIKRDSYLKRTGLLAAEAWVDIDILDIAFRSTFRRTRPMDVPPNGDFKDTWFKTSANPRKSAGSFPSGHTGWAFAVATVVARRHGNHKWVPFAAYGLAALTSISRFTSPNHFASDAFFGGVLGYSVGRFVVLRQ